MPTATTAGTVDLGDGLVINRIGIGTNRIENDDASKAILNAAVEREINFIDTADIYTGGTSEEVIGATVASRDGVHVATKGGYHGAAPDVMTAAIESSLAALALDSIELYYLHRPDRKYPIEQSVEPILEAQRAGKVKHLGLSSVSVEQIEQIQKLGPVSAVQNLYNLDDTGNDDVIDYCTEHGIAFAPFFPLRGSKKASSVAEKHGATAQQVVLAAMLARSPIVVPIPGTREIEHLDSNLAATELELSAEDLEELGIKAG